MAWYLIYIDMERVIKLIRAFDPKKAHGCDEISISIIKINISIVEPLCLIFGIFFETGIYTYVWNKANFIPVHKKESKQSKLN